MPAFAAGAVFALVVGSGTAVAATGGKLILGHSNTAGATTSLTNSSGTALSLSSKSGTAPLKVNRSTKVTNLNSDSVDGLDSSALARTAGKTGSFDTTGQLVDTDGDGSKDAIVAYAGCPSGTQMTGGGASDYTGSGYLVSSAPDLDTDTGVGTEGWLVVVGVDPAANESADDVSASVVCYNPQGAVAGGYGRVTTPRAALAHLSPTLDRALQAKAAAR
jgi:hypothetical protein